MRASEPVEGFLNFLREAQQEYNIASAQEADANDATQDLLHSLELDRNGYHDCAKISIALRQVRQERREAKDRVQQLKPIMDWIGQNTKTIRELERLLGDVRKAERGMEGRFYNHKTDILKQTLGGKR